MRVRVLQFKVLVLAQVRLRSGTYLGCGWGCECGDKMKPVFCCGCEWCLQCSSARKGLQKVAFSIKKVNVFVSRRFFCCFSAYNPNRETPDNPIWIINCETHFFWCLRSEKQNTETDDNVGSFRISIISCKAHFFCFLKNLQSKYGNYGNCRQCREFPYLDYTQQNAFFFGV